jgi:hypothetical protein
MGPWCGVEAKPLVVTVENWKFRVFDLEVVNPKKEKYIPNEHKKRYKGGGSSRRWKVLIYINKSISTTPSGPLVVIPSTSLWRVKAKDNIYCLVLVPRSSTPKRHISVCGGVARKETSKFSDTAVDTMLFYPFWLFESWWMLKKIRWVFTGMYEKGLPFQSTRSLSFWHKTLSTVNSVIWWSE